MTAELKGLDGFMGAFRSRGPAELDTVGIKLQAALEQPGCPVCRRWSETASRALHSLLYENVNDPPTRARLSASYGFCRLHTWQLERTERERVFSALGASILCRSFISLLADDLALPHPEHGQVGQRLEPCYACELASLSEETALARLSVELRRTDFRDAYLSSDGPCLWHLALALGRAAPNERDLMYRRFLEQGPRVQALSGLPADVSLPVRRMPQPECEMCRQAAAAACAAASIHPFRLCRLHAFELPATDEWLEPAWEAVLSWLEPIAVGERGFRRRLAKRIPGCTACQAIIRAEQAAFPRAEAKQIGCFRHTRQFVLSGRGVEARGALHGWLDDLASQLAEFSRKHSWNYRHEPKGREQEACRVALTFLAGGVDVWGTR